MFALLFATCVVASELDFLFMAFPFQYMYIFPKLTFPSFPSPVSLLGRLEQLAPEEASSLFKGFRGLVFFFGWGCNRGFCYKADAYMLLGYFCGVVVLGRGCLNVRVWLPRKHFSEWALQVFYMYLCIGSFLSFMCVYVF